MVKVGFIVEGDSEKIMVESPTFKSFLNINGYELITPVINAKGGGNLLPLNIDAFIKRLHDLNAEKIFVITDLELELTTEIVKQRIQDNRVENIFVAVKALEAWYLAETNAMRRWLNVNNFYENNPEATESTPWERLKEIAQSLNVRGPGSKVSFSKKMVNYYGFDINVSAQHPECNSVRELVGYFSQN